MNSKEIPRWKWPQNIDIEYAPWYTILRRCIFGTPAIILTNTAYMFILAGWGFNTANEFKADWCWP